MTLPIQYAFEGSEVRALMINGAPWFVASDVLNALQLDRKSLARLDADEKGVNSIHTLGGNQEMTVINEPGLYSLVLGSRKAEAKRFKRWVTHDVLPALRKHGTYVMPASEQATDPADAPMAPRVEADQIVSAGRVFRSLFTTARSMGMPRRLAATRANMATEQAIGYDLAAALGASDWLEGSELPTPQRKHYELQQSIRAHLHANDWPQGITTQQVIEATALPLDKGTQMAVGQCLQMLGYTRTRANSSASNGARPWVYVFKQPLLQLEQEVAA